LPVQPAGEVTSMLAGGTSITQEIFQFEFLFDGKVHKVYATFSNVDEALLGTRLLREHRLEINFPARTLWLERIE
jgi:hypothetical protein